MQSAPAAIPATMVPIFAAGLAPTGPGTVSRLAASGSRQDSASCISGTSPADPTRFGSSNTADIAARV